MKNPSLTLRVAALLGVILAATLTSNLARAASATWLASPADNNWITSNKTTLATVNNWSTGLGNWPGGSSTGSGDTATFNNSSSITTVLITNVGGIGTWNIKNITFDTASCAAYTITNAGGVTARFTGGGAITINSTVTQPQLINGSQYRLHTTGALNLANNSTTPTATLTFAAGVKANNSAEVLNTDQAVNLQGSSTGSNAVSGVIADYDSSGTYPSAVIKSGTGTWYLTANNTYSGPTIVNGGLLALVGSGAINGSTNVTVNGGALSIDDGMNLTNPVAPLTVTNGGSLIITNITVQPAVMVPILVVSNATLHLGVNGGNSFTNLVVTNALFIGPNTSISIDQVAGVTVGTTFDLISYVGADPAPANISVTAAPGYAAGTPTVDTVKKLVQVLVTATAPPAALTWQGSLSSGDWDTTTANWTNSAGTLVTYNQGDLVTFDDTALTDVVNLTTALSPGAFTNNTAATYTFGGAGKISGSTSLVKEGSGTAVFTNGTPNSFSGGMIISGGTVQFGNGTTLGGAPASGAVLDNGALVFNHSDGVTSGSAISGSGTVAQSGSGTLTLSGASSFSGGLTINSGAVRANAVSAPGTGLVTANAGTIFVVGALITNSITLSNAVAGTSLTGGFTMSTNKELTIAANMTNLIYSADPQSPLTSFQFLVDANLRGSGTVICVNAPTNAPDSGQGVRFRNTNAISDFSGTIIYTNGTKGELLTLTPAGGSFSPIGTGKLVMSCGAYDGGNATTGPANGTAFCELNLRNNGPGSVIIGNDIVLAGSGAAVINALAGTGGITMGNLKIGAGQELIGYKGASTATNVAIFPTVTLTGGPVTFSPHSATFGSATQAGTDFTLGIISEQISGSGITMAGLGNLTLTGANGYTGDTVVKNGVLFLTGSASIAGSPNIVVAGGARFDVSGLSSAFALGAAQTLSNSTSTAMLSGNADASVGTVSLTYAAGTPSFTVTNGALTLASGTTLKVNNTGAALGKGSYKIISAATTGNAGSVAGVAPSSVTVSGSGLATAVTPLAQINGNELFVVVPNSPPVIARIVTNSTSAGLTWKIAISNLMSAAGWSDPDNDAVTFSSVAPTSNLGKSVTSDASFIYYTAPVTAEDFFTYTISDGTATANGTVYLETVSAPPAPATANQIVKDANGVPTITFAGIPGRTNVVEASSDLQNWTAISTNVAGTNGLWQVIDPDATNYVNRFYRSYQPYP